MMTKLWALADTHLSFGTPDKKMDIFGDKWKDHPAKIEKNWRQIVGPDDIVLIAGDISWGKHIVDAMPDLEWIDKLPGRKIISKGNHDYWWTSNSKMLKAMPSSIQFVNKSALDIDEYSIAGTRLWDHITINFGSKIDFQVNPKDTHPEPKTEEELAHNERIYESELVRLELALSQLNQDKIKVAMVHYPPLSFDLKPSPTTLLLEKYNVDICVFGHLHNVKPDIKLFDTNFRGIHYTLSSCDYLHFTPIELKPSQHKSNIVSN
ncbi:MAG: metallophosphoesterase [Rhabdochlamydiaceae bacterium]|nr:metallophosphoesterase [Candidatus Amphrikana amoebophyrae]